MIALDRTPTRQQQRKQRQAARERFARARKAERTFSRQLVRVAKHVGTIIKGFDRDEILRNPVPLNQTLAKYAETIRPWARAVTTRMITEVDQRDELAWTQLGRDIGRNLRQEVRHAPTGQLMRQLLDEQLDLIQSIPLRAAQRVQRLAIEAVTETGTRAEQLAQEILRTSEVTVGRARLIARTETSRTATVMTQSRAQFVGSEFFMWETARDSDVRYLHRKLQGKVFRWDDPPVTGEDGERSLPGAIYNCRCWASPIIPDEL